MYAKEEFHGREPSKAEEKIHWWIETCKVQGTYHEETAIFWYSPGYFDATLRRNIALKMSSNSLYNLVFANYLGCPCTIWK